MRKNRPLALLRLGVLLSGALLAGCPPPPPIEEEEDAGGPPPDVCNSQADALSLPQCQLTLGAAAQDHIGHAGDEDWYTFTLPATTTPRTLVHLTAGYAVPNTAVNLTVNVLREDGTTSLSRVIDDHGQAAPRPIDIVLSVTEPGARLFVLLSDQAANPARPNFDLRNPYELKVEVLENPDPNEPNDTTPTPIALTAQGGLQQGQGQGFLATANDVDRFSVTVPAGHDLLYLRLTAPRLNPAPPFRLSYAVTNAAGTQLAEGRVLNEFSDVDLSTARKVTAGTYVVTVSGYRSSTTTTAVPGDVRLQYTLEARALVDQDGNEPNDTPSSATTVAFSSVDTQRSLTGRLAYVPDSDWYRVELPASTAPTALRWRLSPGSAGGRYPVLPGLLDRQLRVLKDVTVTNAAALCRDEWTTCPKNYEGNPLHQAMVEGYCAAAQPRCLLAAREENLGFQALRNFEGVLQIPPHSGSHVLFFLVEDEKNDWADDRDYSVSFEWQSDADEAARFSGGTEQRAIVAVPQVSSGGFPVPPAGSLELTGTLHGGFGRLYRNDPNTGSGVRGPEDYEAVPTDVDLYELTLPAVAAPEDRTWELQWTVDKVNGQLPGNLALDFRFCRGTATCNPLTTQPSTTSVRTLAFKGGELGSWHNQSALQPIYDETNTTTSVTITARAYPCFCFQRNQMQAGKAYLKVVGVDRSAYVPITYRIRTALTDYPQSYAGVGGEGTLSCPAPVALDAGAGLPFAYDGGCGFLR